MGKTLETKKKILNLLKKKDMTVTELGRELNLSAATVSQHMEELQNMGAVEKIDNEHFKKLKYYRIREAVNMNIAKYVVVVLVVIVAASALYFYAGRSGSLPGSSTTPNAANNNTSVTSPGVTGAFACPLETYQLNGSVTSSLGLQVYYLNSSYGTIPDYVIGSDSSGMLYAQESVSGVLNNNNPSFTTNRTHYASLIQEGSGRFNMTTSGIGVSVSPATYNAVDGARFNLTVTIITNQTPAEKTYWLRIDGPCDGGVSPVLVTVGNRPYNGTVTEIVAPYA